MSEPRNEQLRKERTGSPEKGGLCEDGRRQGRALEGPVPLRSRVTPVLNHREGIFGEVLLVVVLMRGKKRYAKTSPVYGLVLGWLVISLMAMGS